MTRVRALLVAIASLAAISMPAARQAPQPAADGVRMVADEGEGAKYWPRWRGPSGQGLGSAHGLGDLHVYDGGLERRREVRKVYLPAGLALVADVVDDGGLEAGEREVEVAGVGQGSAKPFSIPVGFVSALGPCEDAGLFKTLGSLHYKIYDRTERGAEAYTERALQDLDLFQIFGLKLRHAGRMQTTPFVSRPQRLLRAGAAVASAHSPKG